jgi:hypothetical protein
MGLDQFAWAYKGEPSKDADGCKRYPDERELASWRKHPNLQGWMANRWLDSNPGMSAVDFNCVPFELDEDMLNELEAAIRSADLPATSGFFFGGDSDDYYREQDLKFISNAKKMLADGYRVVYNSWW